ncbi:MAG TPA: hypothetical protein VN830_05605 [Verrucomicrobiae bacterium]|nr:hypothetical protein [Verrucomicrobiae bacterium]
MRQIIHIFKKDVRRHWPEILIGLILLGLYVRITIRGVEDRFTGYSFPLLLFSERSIPVLMIFFWIFLSVRLVQGEAPVGNRQWWVTKPYEWWMLLAAKELFLLAFIGLPLFCVQLFLLHHAGFPIFLNVRGVLNMQLGLALALFLPSAALGSLTKNLGQAVIGVVIVFAGLWASFTLIERIPSSGMSFAVEGSGEIVSLVLLAGVIGSLGWQYARRRTWASRGLLLAAVVLVLLLAVLTPYAKFVERQYPLIQASDTPAHLSAGTIDPAGKKKFQEFDFMPEVVLSIPIRVSAITPGHVVLVHGILVKVQTADGLTFSSGWKPQWIPLWSEDDQKVVRYELKREEYKRTKSQHVALLLELALTEYKETEARDLVLGGAEFTDQRLGICHLSPTERSQIACRRPFGQPGLIASFDPAQSRCDAWDDENQLPEDKVTHYWSAPSDGDSPDPGLNPVDEYQISFGPRMWLGRSAEYTKTKPKVVHLCPGARVRLAKPEQVREVRTRMQFTDVRLEDLADN